MSWTYRRMTSSPTPLLHCRSIPCSPPHRVRASQSGRCLWREIVSDRRRRRRYWWWGCLFNFFYVFACRAFPGCWTLRLEEDQRPDGQHGRLPAHAATVDHQRCFHQSAWRLQVTAKCLLYDYKNPESVLPSQCSSSPLFMLQGVRSILSGLPGRLRRVERGDGVHASRAAPHRPVQPAWAVPKRGVSLPVSALHAAGHQYSGSLRQVKLHIGNPSWFATLQTKTHHTFWQIRITK